jgi:hypothetical protein
MTRAVWIVALTLLLPASAHAQSSDATASTLALKRGEKVIVTRGTTHETLRGRVVRIADDGLVLADGPTRHTVPLGDLERVERPKDRIWNGALIGYGVGFVTGAAMVLSDPCRPQPGAFINLCFNSPDFALFYGGLITGPIGMAVGAIGDAIVRRPRVVFDRGSGSHVEIAVAATVVRGGGALRVAIAF